MPFKSKAQWRACFAKNDPNWDCGEWADSTPSYKELPKKKKKEKKAESQEDIFEAIKQHLPAEAQHASGGMPDVKGLSDVDISLYHQTPEDVLSLLPENTTIRSKQDDTGSIEYAVPGYSREVNVFATPDKARAQRAVDHRNTTIALREQQPALYELAKSLKEQGQGTEQAWADVLGIKDDPYVAMRDTKAMLEAAEKTANSGRCWEGYEPVPGKEPYSDDSCRPKKSKKSKAGAKSKEKQSSASTLAQMPLGQVMADIISNSLKTRGLAKESNMLGKVEQKAQQQVAAQNPANHGVPGADPNEIAKQFMALRNPGADAAAPASALPGQNMGMLQGYNQPGPLGANLANSQLGSLPGGFTGAGRSVGEAGPMKMAESADNSYQTFNNAQMPSPDAAGNFLGPDPTLEDTQQSIGGAPAPPGGYAWPTTAKSINMDLSKQHYNKPIDPDISDNLYAAARWLGYDNLAPSVKTTPRQIKGKKYLQATRQNAIDYRKANPGLKFYESLKNKDLDRAITVQLQPGMNALGRVSFHAPAATGEVNIPSNVINLRPDRTAAGLAIGGWPAGWDDAKKREMRRHMTASGGESTLGHEATHILQTPNKDINLYNEPADAALRKAFKQGPEKSKLIKRRQLPVRKSNYYTNRLEQEAFISEAKKFYWKMTGKDPRTPEQIDEMLEMMREYDSGGFWRQAEPETVGEEAAELFKQRLYEITPGIVQNPSQDKTKMAAVQGLFAGMQKLAANLSAPVSAPDAPVYDLRGLDPQKSIRQRRNVMYRVHVGDGTHQNVWAPPTSSYDQLVNRAKRQKLDRMDHSLQEPEIDPVSMIAGVPAIVKNVTTGLVSQGIKSLPVTAGKEALNEVASHTPYYMQSLAAPSEQQANLTYAHPADPPPRPKAGPAPSPPAQIANARQALPGNNTQLAGK